VANAFYTSALARIISGDLDMTAGTVNVYLLANLTSTGLENYPQFDASHTTLAEIVATEGYLVSIGEIQSKAMLGGVTFDGDNLLTGGQGWASTSFPFGDPGEYIHAFVIYKGTEPIAWIDTVTAQNTGTVGLPVEDIAGNEFEIYWNASGIFRTDTNTVFTPAVGNANYTPGASWYDAEVVTWAENTLRDNLDVQVALGNQFVTSSTKMANVLAITPTDSALVARPEADLDERGHRPQRIEGVWVRVTDSVDQPALMGPQVTEHTLVVTTFVNATDTEDSTPPTVLPTGYKRCMHLARAVDRTLQAGMDCHNYGVFNIEHTGGGRLPRALRGMPTVQVVTNTYTVYQKTDRAIGVAS
jgi:hypothetical protein